MTDIQSRRYTAANHGAENTSKKPNRSRMGPQVGFPSIQSVTRTGSRSRWGRTDPGMDAMASRKSRMRAILILVNWRQHQRRKPVPSSGGGLAGSVVI